jgi:acetoin utilization deacetylase AcuC-like enzyme
MSMSEVRKRNLFAKHASREVEYVNVTGVKNVFCCIRPPGHHAGRYGSTRGCTQNGFCLLNNVAVGASYARIKYGIRKIAIIDIDAHFGNGTAEIFEKDEHTFYGSVHFQLDGVSDLFFPSAPGCLMGPDTEAQNTILVNVYPPLLKQNTKHSKQRLRGRAGFRTAIKRKIIPALRAFKPDFVFISAGFDGVHTDPIGGRMGLKPEDFHWAACEVKEFAEECCGARLVSVLEGGYDVDKTSEGLADSAAAHVLGMAGRDLE